MLPKFLKKSEPTEVGSLDELEILFRIRDRN